MDYEENERLSLTIEKLLEKIKELKEENEQLNRFKDFISQHDDFYLKKYKEKNE